MSNSTTTAIETTAAATASKATYAGGATTVFGYLASIDWLALAGFFIAIAGFFVNAYFQYKRHKREELESLIRMQRDQDKHEIEMAKLKGECNVKK